MTTPSERVHLKQLMKLLLDHEPQCDYPTHDVRGALDAATFSMTEAQMRAHLKAGFHLMMDCSAAVTCVARWCGLDDPSGFRYRWCGYTGSILNHLSHYTNPASAGVGAIVVFGPGTGEHAAMVYETGADPLLWSHGFEGGPLLVRLSKERALHKPPVTFCSIVKL